MVIYEVSVFNRVISLESITGNALAEDTVGGNKNDKVVFTLEEEWQNAYASGLDLKASFVWRGRYYISKILWDEDSKKYYCEVPPLFGTNLFRLGIYVGETTDEDIYLASTELELPCQLSIRDFTKTPHHDYSKKYTDLVYQAANEAIASADEAEKSAQIAQSAKQNAENAAETIVKSASQIEENAQNISVLKKRVTNLEKGTIGDQFETDSSIAYVKDVPSNALPYAEISKIGGMSYRVGDEVRHGKVTAVESVGANLIPYPHSDTTKTTNGITFTDNGDGTVTANGKATADTYFGVMTQTNFSNGEYYFTCTPSSTDGTYYSYVIYDNNKYAYEYGNGVHFTIAEQKISFIGIAISNGTTVSNVVFTPMLTKGSTPLPYAPYIKNTLEIPEAVQALDGYGEGLNESVYNYIDYEKKQFVKRVGSVDMGTLNWEYQGGVFYLLFDNKKAGFSNLQCDTYLNANTTWSDAPNDTINGHESMGYVYIKDDTYTDAATFKSAMSGVMLYYELATPEVVDISDILPVDNFIGVEGGGFITAVNEYGYAVPTTITYQLGV